MAAASEFRPAVGCSFLQAAIVACATWHVVCMAQQEVAQDQQQQSQAQALERGSASPEEEGAMADRKKNLRCPPDRSHIFANLTLAAQLKRSGRLAADLVWDPPEEKYLVMECHYGRATNRLICIQNHIIFAGLLNRTLVIDTTQLGPTVHHYNWSLLIDVGHVRQCFGERAILTTEEYRARHGGQKLQVDAVLCWGPRCDFNWGWWRNSVEVPQVTHHTKRGSLEHFQEFFVGKYGHLRAIFVGDLTYKDPAFIFAMSIFSAVPFRRRPQCVHGAALLPNARIMMEALDYVHSAFEGRPFLALHLRRGDFWRACASKRDACFTQEEVSSTLIEETEAGALTDIVICSDMHWRQGRQLRDMLLKHNKSLNIVLNPTLPKEKSDLVGRAKEGEGAFEKAVMSHALIFIGTRWSTFSLDVERMRISLGTSSCRDFYLHH